MKSLVSIFAIAAATSIGFSAISAPETYMPEKNHTNAKFEYNHFGYSNQQHHFDGVSGKIVIDREAKSGSVDIVIDVKSVNTGIEKFNAHLKSDDFFDAEKFPGITYKSSKLRFDGDKLVSVDGDLTIKGVTRPVALIVTSFSCKPHPISKKEGCGANATTKIKRSDFNAGKYVPAVSDEVTLSIAIEAYKE